MKTIYPIGIRSILLKLSFSLFFLCLIIQINAQSGIPYGSCGIEYIYDASGNMIKRQYVCNNTILRIASPSAKASTLEKMISEKEQKTTIERVDVLFPNPTTGQFRIKMTKELKNDFPCIPAYNCPLPSTCMGMN